MSSGNLPPVGESGDLPPVGESRRLPPAGESRRLSLVDKSSNLPSVDEYVDGVRSGSLSWLSRAITLVESTNDEHRLVALSVLSRLTAPSPPAASDSAAAADAAVVPSASVPSSASAGSDAAVVPSSAHAAVVPSASVLTAPSPPAATHRIGVTGAAGAGKSTLLDALGSWLCEQGRRVAVLAVDPSSAVSGGSILGDKTRMSRLASNPSAFVRPSPSGAAVSGVTGTTFEAVLLLESVGFDVVFVETVGAGQSTLGVADLADSVLTLVAPGGGDALQGIKRGLLEVTDVLVVNKADGDSLAAARRTAADYDSALRLLRPSVAGWRPPVLTASALEGAGIEQVWERLCEHRRALAADGGLERRRGEQRVRWMWHLIEGGLLDAFRRRSQVRASLDEAEDAVRSGTLTPSQAALGLVERFVP